MQAGNADGPCRESESNFHVFARMWHGLDERRRKETALTSIDKPALIHNAVAPFNKEVNTLIKWFYARMFVDRDKFLRNVATELII